MADTAEVWHQGPGVMESAWRHRWWVLLGLLLGLLAGYGYAARQPSVYESSTRITIADPSTVGIFGDVVGGGDRSDADRYIRNQAEEIESQPVRRAAAAELGLVELEDEVGIQATPSEGSDSITITVRHPEAVGAAETADAVVRAYDRTVTDQVAATADRVAGQLAPAAAELETQLADLGDRLEAEPESAVLANQYSSVADQLAEVRSRSQAIEIDAALFGSGIRLSEEAEVPGSASQPKPLRTALLGGFLGLIVSAGVAWWANARRSDPKGLAQSILQVPLLAEIPDFATDLWSKLPAFGSEGKLVRGWRSSSLEPYSYLMANLSLALRDVGGNIVVVTSMAQSEGKSLTALNLALAAATDGRSVLLLDADVHRSELAKVVPEIVAGATLSDLAGDDEASMVARRWPVEGVENLYVMSTGRNVKPSYFRSAGFRQRVETLGKAFDFVVVDSAPVVPVIDTIDIAESAHGVIVIVTPNTSRGLLEEGQRRLDHISPPVLGYVLNRSKDPLPTTSYSYSSNADARGSDGGLGWQEQPTSLPQEPLRRPKTSESVAIHMEQGARRSKAEGGPATVQQPGPTSKPAETTKTSTRARRTGEPAATASPRSTDRSAEV